ncbi:MAG: Aerobic cobaltochelatase subunit CobT [Alphaproteobacteria bacterium ADurb.Bin438]|nr:MAG: Aerobic cobaltochelatase subunit CobT [Alphaproteobacteria bacterium ADurb.Bin438]
MALPYLKEVHKLIRLIKAKQLPYWLYDQEEGHVDASLLTRVVVSPTTPMKFIKEKITDFRPTLFYFFVKGEETDADYQFIYDFCLALERGGAVYSMIKGIKEPKQKIRGLEFNRKLMKEAEFNLEAFKKLKQKRKIIINLTDEKTGLVLNKLNHEFSLKGDYQALIQSLYEFFDKD